MSLAAETDVQEVGVVGQAQQMFARLITPAVSHMIAFLHRADYRQTAGSIPVLLGLV